MSNTFHNTSVISVLSSIDTSSKGTHTVIGPNTIIDDFVKIKHVGGGGDIVIGGNCYINSGCVLYSGSGISIGNSVLIGPNCSITPTNHKFDCKSKEIRLQGHENSKGGVIIEDDVWIGANVVILDGATIKKGSVVGANSMVNSELPEYSISYGSPCKTVKYRK
jgi:virginiamycin A acetyltransferase